MAKLILRTRPIIPLAIAILALSVVFITGCSGKTETMEVTPTSESATLSTEAGAPSTTLASAMELRSSAFENGGTIPVKYANTGMPGGRNISIPLEWKDAPAGTKSFAVAMIDTSARDWVHWMVINIPSTTTSFPEDASGTKMPAGSKELTNSFGKQGYGGPQPPAGTGPHNYITTVYALSVDKVAVPQQPTAGEFEAALGENILAKTTLTGLLSR